MCRECKTEISKRDRKLSAPRGISPDDRIPQRGEGTCPQYHLWVQQGPGALSLVPLVVSPPRPQSCPPPAGALSTPVLSSLLFCPPPSYSAHLPSPDLLPQPRGPGTSDPSSPQRGAVRGAPERGHHVDQAPGEQVTKACPRSPRSGSCGARGTGERQDGGNALAVQSVGRRDPKCRWRSRAWIPRAAEGGKPDAERPG